MAKTITLERAIAIRATPGQMLAIADWHEDRIAGLNEGRRVKDYSSKVACHRQIMKAMRLLAAELETAPDIDVIEVAA